MPVPAPSQPFSSRIRSPQSTLRKNEPFHISIQCTDEDWRGDGDMRVAREHERGCAARMFRWSINASSLGESGARNGTCDICSERSVVRTD